MRKLLLLILVAGVAFGSVNECSNMSKQAKILDGNASVGREFVAGAYALAASCFGFENVSRNCTSEYEKAAFIYSNASSSPVLTASAYYGAASCAEVFSPAKCALDAERAGDIYPQESAASKVEAYTLAARCAETGRLRSQQVGVLTKLAELSRNSGDLEAAASYYERALSVISQSREKCSLIETYASLLREAGDEEAARGQFEAASACRLKYADRSGCEQALLSALETVPEPDKPLYYQRLALCFWPTGGKNESMDKCQQYYTQSADLFASASNNTNASIDYKRAGDCKPRGTTSADLYYMCAQYSIKAGIESTGASYNATITSYNRAITCYIKTKEPDKLHERYVTAYFNAFKLGEDTSFFNMSLLAGDPRAPVRLPAEVEAETRGTFISYVLIAAGIFIGLVAFTIFFKLFEKPPEEDVNRRLERLFRAREQ